MVLATMPLAQILGCLQRASYADNSWLALIVGQSPIAAPSNGHDVDGAAIGDVVAPPVGVCDDDTVGAIAPN
jgi:hypothetical protein